MEDILILTQEEGLLNNLHLIGATESFFCDTEKRLFPISNKISIFIEIFVRESELTL